METTSATGLALSSLRLGISAMATAPSRGVNRVSVIAQSDQNIVAEILRADEG
jgi:hypothetical protein